MRLFTTQFVIWSRASWRDSCRALWSRWPRYCESQSQEDPISPVICREIPITLRMSLTSDMEKTLSSVMLHWGLVIHLITHLCYCCVPWLSGNHRGKDWDPSSFSTFFYTPMSVSILYHSPAFGRQLPSECSSVITLSTQAVNDISPLQAHWFTCAHPQGIHQFRYFLSQHFHIKMLQCVRNFSNSV